MTVPTALAKHINTWSTCGCCGACLICTSNSSQSNERSPPRIFACTSLLILSFLRSRYSALPSMLMSSPSGPSRAGSTRSCCKGVSRSSSAGITRTAMFSRKSSSLIRLSPPSPDTNGELNLLELRSACRVEQRPPSKCPSASCFKSEESTGDAIRGFSPTVKEERLRQF